MRDTIEDVVRDDDEAFLASEREDLLEVVRTGKRRVGVYRDSRVAVPITIPPIELGV